MNYTFRVFNKKLLKINKADGIYLYTSENKKILDTTGGSTSFNTLGWNNTHINKAITAQLKKFSHIDYKFWNDENVEKLSKILLEKSEHKLDYVYYSGNSGSEACEAAMKLSYLTHLSNGEKKTWFIGREQSYHGITTDALSIADRPNLDIFNPLLPLKRAKIKQHHYLKEKHPNESIEHYAKRSAFELEKKILELGPSNVCAFIGETMMGGLVGDVPPTKNYWKYIRHICDKYNIHLILDECYSGLGSSGKYYCCDWDGITPDFIFVAKILTSGYVPLSAVITKKKFAIKIYNKFERLLHGSTFQGHSLGIAAAIATQKIVTKERMINHIKKTGEYLRNNLFNELKNNNFFLDIRGRGLRFSLEYNCKDKNNFGLKLTENMFKKHSIIISGKWHRVCFTPAFIINKKQCDLVLDKFIKEFRLLSKNWKNK